MNKRRVAYLVNQYPKVSHSFIRREIRALERHGLVVDRLALRGWGDDLADPDDEAERTVTRYVLRGGVGGLLQAALAQLLRAPAAFVAALVLATRVGWRADRPLLVHYIYLAEACVVAGWMRRDTVMHVHAHFGTNSTTVAMLAATLAKATYSFTAHGPEEFDKPQAIRLGEKIRKAEFVVAISSFGRSQLNRWVDQTQWAKIHVVRCGVNAGMAEPLDALPTETRRLVCVGRICEQKGQLLLMAAFRRVLDRGVQANLVLAGDGEMRGDVERMISSLSLQDHVSITGWISGRRVIEELQAARALVLPSFAEGLPVVIMEAMALGRPVVSTYVAGIPELVKDKQSGWLAPAGDLDALVEALIDCLRAPQQVLEEMGRVARAAVFKMHDVDVEAAKLATLFAAVPAGAER